MCETMTAKKIGGMRAGSTDDELTGERHLALQFIEKNKGDWQHRREGLQIPGKLIAHLEEAAHHLAIATCQHLGTPCTPCLVWADLVMFSAAKEKEDENAEWDREGNAHVQRISDSVESSGKQGGHGASGKLNSVKALAQGRTSSSGVIKEAARGRRSTRDTGKGNTDSTDSTGQPKQSRPRRKKKVSRSVK